MGFTSRKRSGDVARKKNKDKYAAADDGGSGGKSSRRGGARSRIISRKGSGGVPPAAVDKASKEGPAVVDPNAPLRRRKPIDLTLLARGMSARAVGSRVSSHIKVLADEEIDKDLRHMEAYEVACTTYSQQFFAYTNQELVSRGVYGPVPPLPGSPGYSGPGFVRSQGYDPATGQYHPPSGQGSPRGYQRTPDGRMVPVGSPSSAITSQAAPFAMPVKIDPEEEKRLAQLKKKITISESKRETLEGEYESLKAHYWYATKVLDRTKHSVIGQVELLKDVVQRRGQVVALRRVRCAVARDILACLEARSKGVPIGASKTAGAAATPGADAMEGVEPTTEGSQNKEEEKKDADGEKKATAEKSPEIKDLVDCWNWIDSQLNDAEKACMEATSPANLLDLKKVLAGQKQVQPTEPAAESDVQASSTSGDKSRSGKSGEKDKKKDKRGAADEGSSTDQRDPNSTKDLEAALFIGEHGVLPWMSQTMARTPRGVPVYCSYLSTAPDRSGAFGTGGAFGSVPDSLAWLEANLPKMFEPDYTKDREELDRLREEVEYLAEELEMERDNNKEMQNEIISNRNRSDEMCSMMSILRTETEAVLNRHNMILDTKEARGKAEQLHKAHLEALERDRDRELKEEINAMVEGQSSDAAMGAVASPSPEAAAAEATGKTAAGNKSFYDATKPSGMNGDDSSNKRSLEGGDAESPSRSNGGLNATKRRRRM